MSANKLISLLPKLDSHSLFARLENAGELPVSQQSELVEEAGTLLRNWGKVSILSKLQEAEILYNLHRLWFGEGREPLSFEVTQKWDNDFYTFVDEFLVREGGAPATVTVNNLISVWRDWTTKSSFSDKFPETVKVTDGEGKIVEVPFLPSDSTYSKLLVSRAAVRGSDNVPEEFWSALVDDSVSVSSLKKMVKQIKGETENKKDNDFYVFFSEGILFGVEGGEVVGSFNLIEENKDSPLFHKTVDFILRSLGLENTEVRSATVNGSLPLAAITDDKRLVINSAGTRFGSFSAEQAEIIGSTIMKLNGD